MLILRKTLHKRLQNGNRLVYFIAVDKQELQKLKGESTVDTAASSHFRKKLLSLVLTLVVMLTCLPAALAVDLNVDAGFSISSRAAAAPARWHPQP